jgi:N-acyl-D-amino-acid deacylase
MDSVIRQIERARAAGIDVSADMYTYLAGGTGLTATMPPYLQDGGFDKLRERLRDPAIRQKTIQAMNSSPDSWENFYHATGSPEKILLVAFTKDSLKKYTGKSLAEVARIRGKSPEETAMDLIIEDSSRVGTIYFFISEENIKKQIALPWVSFGSDEGSYSTEGVFLKSNAHPRAYGNFARVIGKYVRDEKALTLANAVYKLSKLPAVNLKLKKRGELKVGNFADIVIFDPATVQDHATFDKPHQYATGVTTVFVNGVAVLKDGEHTGAMPGRFLKGPGWKK